MPRGRKLQPGDQPTGRLVVRMPTGLHGHLAAMAAREGVSLNALLVALLAGASGWRADKMLNEKGTKADSSRSAR